jgi:ABC-type multidrug transport system fused ATPase/permease subunit
MDSRKNIPKARAVTVLLRALPELFRAAPLETGILVLVLLGQSSVPVLTLYLTRFTLDGIAALSQGSNISVSQIALWWTLTLLLGVILAPINQVLQGNVAEKFTAHVNITLMNKSQELLGLDLLEDKRFYDDLNLLQSGAANRPLNVLVMLVYIARDLFTLIGLSIILASVGWWVPLIILISAYPMALMTLRLREIGWNALISRTPEARSMAYESNVALNHTHAAEVRLYNLIPWLRERYLQAFSTSHNTMRKVRLRQALGILPSSVFSIFVSSGLFVWCVSRAIDGQLTIGQIVIIVTGLAQIQQIVFSLIESTGMVFERGLYFQKYFDFLSAQSQLDLPKAPKALKHSMPIINFNHVSFQYPDGRKALEDVTFTVNPGEKIAIVGENGAGKTTLIKLLLRFYDVTEGTITLDDVNIKEIELTAWRKNVAAVFQDFGHYSYTIRENVILANTDFRDEAKVHDALEKSGFQNVVDTLENGVDTRLGKAFDGTELSGGQWQKLAIARALYRNAQVLVLDEPTAALDPRSEYDVYKQFASLSRSHTTFLITHRLGSVLMADRVLVMKQGRLVEQGHHDELIVRKGEYAELWNMQVGQYNKVML